MSETITAQEAVIQLNELALEADKLAEAFRPSAKEGNTMVIPVVLALRLCEVLATASRAMRTIAGEEA